MTEHFTLEDFVRESNRIESIHRRPLKREIDATHALIFVPQAPCVADLIDFVEMVAPGHILRDKPGLNVRVGSYIAPPGGPAIRTALEELLSSNLDAYHMHVAYETLHPFTDGNGRSGRALWLWRMGGIERAPLGFLHHFYYQALEHSPFRAKGEER